MFNMQTGKCHPYVSPTISSKMERLHLLGVILFDQQNSSGLVKADKNILMQSLFVWEMEGWPGGRSPWEAWAQAILDSGAQYTSAKAL